MWCSCFSLTFSSLVLSLGKWQLFIFNVIDNVILVDWLRNYALFCLISWAKADPSKLQEFKPCCPFKIRSLICLWTMSPPLLFLLALPSTCPFWGIKGQQSYTILANIPEMPTVSNFNNNRLLWPAPSLRSNPSWAPLDYNPVQWAPFDYNPVISLPFTFSNTTFQYVYIYSCSLISLGILV